MSDVQRLEELTMLATHGFRGGESVTRAMEIVRSRIGADQVVLIYGVDDGFVPVPAETELEFTRVALWLIQRDLVERNGPAAFGRTGARVVGFHSGISRRPCTHVAMLLPISGGYNPEMLVCTGDWPRGLSRSSITFLTAAKPALGLLFNQLVARSELNREQHQLSALINISHIISKSEDLEQVLSKVAAGVAAAAGVEFVTIDLIAPTGDVELRCVNYALPEGAKTGQRWKNASNRPDMFRSQVLSSRRAIVFPDAQNDPRLPEPARSFFTRTLIRSTGVFPLVARDEVLGVMSIASQHALQFNDDERQLFDGLATQAATAVMGIRLYEQLAEQSALLERALETEREHARRDALTGALNYAAITEHLQREIQLAEGIQPIVVAIADVDTMKAVNDTYGHLSGDAALRSVATALDCDGAVVGRYGGDEFLVVLPGASRSDAERYAARVQGRIQDAPLIDEDTGTLIQTGLSVGVAVYPEEAFSLVELVKAADNAMYAEKSRKKTRHDARRLDDRVANIVSDLVPLLTSPGSLGEKLNLVAARLSAGTGYDAVDCEIFDETTSVPQVQYTTTEDGMEPLAAQWHKEVQRAHRTPGQAVISQLLSRTRRPLILDDLQNDVRLSQVQRNLLAKRGLQSALIAPMFWQDNLIGTLAVGRKEKAAFHLSDAQFLAAVANQTTAIVRMATLVDNLQRAGERLQDSQAETVLMLAAAAEAHDHTTGVHLENIRTLSEAISRELGYDDRQVRELGLAAALHDIGKISVPDVILSSPIRFQADDWETARMWDVMKQHSVWGAEFLRGRHGFELAANVARWHHERWDGTGYPDQLAGEQIPQQVAVVTVADAFDAMVSDRPYRRGRPVADAIEEVQRWSGRQFSPAAVDALVRLYQAGRLPIRHEEQSLAA